jgi:hypothetical protein
VVLVGVHLAISKSSAQTSAYAAAVATLPGRIDEPTSKYEIGHLIEILNDLRKGGDLPTFGSGECSYRGDFGPRPL